MPETFFIKVAGLVFYCEFSEISKNTFFYRTPLVAASVSSKFYILFFSKILGLQESEYPESTGN